MSAELPDASLVAPVGTPATVDQLTDPAILSALIKREVASIDEATSLSGAGGLSGEMSRLRITLADGSKMSIVVKTTRPNGTEQSAALGLARESYFYYLFATHFQRKTGGALPETYFVYGDCAKGQKLILMEDLSDGIQAGYFFGPGSPLNWGKDLDALTKNAPGVTAESITEVAFTMAAKFHALHWMDRSLLQHPWLRATDWHAQEGESTFHAAQKQAAQAWATNKTKIHAGESKVQWDPRLLKCMDSSLYKVSWGEFQKRLQRQQWTLVHSDFHPANMMWIRDHIVLLDYEVVGLGSGPQDLSQFLISHMTPEARRQCEERLLRKYYSVLSETVDGSAYTWEQCWADYVLGGVERWVWLLCILTAMCPDKMVQYWHDQLLAFILDHGITPANIGMPRV